MKNSVEWERIHLFALLHRQSSPSYHQFDNHQFDWVELNNGAIYSSLTCSPVNKVEPRRLVSVPVTFISQQYRTFSTSLRVQQCRTPSTHNNGAYPSRSRTLVCTYKSGTGAHLPDFLVCWHRRYLSESVSRRDLRGLCGWSPGVVRYPAVRVPMSMSVPSSTPSSKL